MTFLSFIHRIVFYGTPILVTYIVVAKLNLSVEGDPLWPFLAALATICGAALSTNYISLKNYNELDKGIDIGYWGGERLHLATAIKRQIAQARAVMGIIACLTTAGMSAFSRYTEIPLTGLVLTITLVAPILAIVFAILSILEAVSISQSESDLLQMQREFKARKKLREDLADDADEETK